jgi:hypothetical protein
MHRNVNSWLSGKKAKTKTKTVRFRRGESLENTQRLAVQFQRDGPLMKAW